MDFGKRIRGASVVSSFCYAMLWPLGTPLAASFPEFVDPNPSPFNLFGARVVPLSTGNVVITSPNDDFGGTDAGAVYLFNGLTGALISTLRGSTAGDNVGSSVVTALSNGNYVVRSPDWDNGAAANAGAVTWGSGTSGVSGVVSATNSLVGSSANDQVGISGVTALSNGNYVVSSRVWNNGAVLDAGAATWGSGVTGVTGAISAANSLVGSTAGDNVSFAGVTALSNGNYVVRSQLWDNGGVADAGAATWASGTTGVTGVVSPANSLVGSTAGDNVGLAGVTALSNGNYVVRSENWDNGAAANAGAVTWGSGTTGVTGVVSAANSLVGSKTFDLVGSFGVTALANGNYVVASPNWDNGAVLSAGAVTWGNGTTGVTGAVSAANSLIGAANDVVGTSVTALSNGNYVVASPNWDNGAVIQAGAVTWCNGTTGLTGMVSAANSLIGAAGDNVGIIGATALSNGNYVVVSWGWNNGAVLQVGAVTWCNGTTGVTGVVSAANSLVGSTTNDQVGNFGVTALANGNYVVRSSNWDNGGVVDAGAATWGSGTTGVTGAVSAANSLVGSTASDNIGSGSFAVTALANGNYVVRSPNWDKGGVADAGAATWGSGTTGVTGVISAANSLVGSTAGDNVGSGVTALANGDYVVRSTNWDRGALAQAGAATLGSGTTGVTGVISAANSLVGAAANTNLLLIVEDQVNSTFIAPFVNEGGGRVRLGPLTLVPEIASALDVPADQGGWLYLTYFRSALDDAGAALQVATYEVWRLVPDPIPADGRTAEPGAAHAARPEPATTERLRAALPEGLDAREADGKFYVVVPSSRAPRVTSVFPPGSWELLLSVPALQQDQYLVAVPTISNAAANHFVVTAQTTTPSIWYVSAPASGQSVDNLAPAEPTQLTAHYSGGQTNLLWAPSAELDLDSYLVYRGASAEFVPSEGNRIATLDSPGHADVGPSGSYYKVSATDVNGNESGFALIGPDQTTDVGDDRPVVFALEGVWPNPTRGAGLHVAFSLPTEAAARLELLDVSGRRVLEREVGSLGAGRHTVNLAEGRRVAPGLYWLRLAQGPNRRTTRVAVSE